jgi:hypothetical protein
MPFQFLEAVTASLMMEAVYSSETLVPIYKLTQRYYSKDKHLHDHEYSKLIVETFHSKESPCK